ncbi:substrate-binding domain-containing protein [Eubacterium oxidoreducens]|uniref:Putative molybdopterin biosynthesis protein n=1 Tax=Eubacterium oxidoreducens TaxID=1732 RepID=A0A1G6C146_EUBOX|nr:helix-turn-helix transcriptional regulator [Eubacterium oxidoreducens]SDB26558.1 putative molybdopterin biosynthesis protein [Eubacterium oxidoreducens]
MENQFLTPVEVAQMLQLKKNTVYDMIKRGDLKATKMGKQFRITLKDVYEYMGADMPGEQETDLVLCGQDAILDILSAMYNQGLKKDAKRLLRSPMGSYNGLFEMYQNEGYIATAHLWDGETDSYNIPYMKKMLPGEQIAVFHLVDRMQGLYVAKGNPLGICNIEDIKASNATLVNREKGSGIRVYLDEKLKQLGIMPTEINGYYTHVATSHMQAAAMVSRGNGDVSMGSQRVAIQVPEIDFIPQKRESYDIVFREADLKKESGRRILDILKSDEFKCQLNAFEGYYTDGIGERIF